MLRPDFTVPIVRLHMDARRRAGALRLLRAGLAAAGGGLGPAAGVPAGGLRGLRGRRSGGARRRGAGADRRGARAMRRSSSSPAISGWCWRRSTRSTPAPARKAALRRHVWRPARFHALLAALRRRARARSGRARAELLAAEAEGRTAGADRGAGAAVGLRERGRGGGAGGAAGRGGGDAAARRRRGGADRGGAGGRGHRDGRARPSCGRWRAGLPGLERGGRPLRGAARRRSRRAASRPRGLRFEASFGRTTLEYYDGFVFGALPRGRRRPAADRQRRALRRADPGARGRGAASRRSAASIRPEALVALRSAR